ncbi:MAG: 30S ribosomal protein S8 [Bacteroidales bacterium]|nr:30S ribosomal protein S8 [Bacteroidales bacterium]
MSTDSIADFLTRVRNALQAKHRVVEVPASKMRIEIARILKEHGYILSYKVDEKMNKKILKLALKYHPVTKMPTISMLKRVSTPGLRKYTSVEDMPRVMNGLGIAIISTNKGLMTDKEARKHHVGGEIICYIA